mmetsp:Transcript_13950/g.38347  ORF Transcript_13950/g.38347 Transcript_13950/m.38347 type:complete len:297 (-) Transcript_13950:91-981(-)
MADHCEEQEMEAEALTAIFDECLEVIQSAQPFRWAVTLYPEQHVDDDDAEDPNHVGIKLTATIPLTYPEALPELEIEILKGLVSEHQDTLLQLANEEAEANLGLPSIFAISERLREWLIENNVKGLDDTSMFAQMKRRELESEKATQKASQQFESQKHVEQMTEAEAEELAVRKRRAEGTPVNRDTFEIWKAKFEKEMEEQWQRDKENASENSNKKASKKEKVVDKSGRVSGFLQFNGKAGTLNLEAIEAAADDAQVDEDEEENLENVDEGLFDVDDDDLDDLDFDDDDEEEDPDI